MYVIPGGVTAMSFDIWKTLLNGNKAFTRPRLALIFDLLGHPMIDIEELRAAYLAADRFYNDEAERDGLDYGLRERLNTMYETLDIKEALPGSAALANVQASVGRTRLQPEYMPSFIEPDLPDTLAALITQGYTLGLLSNTGMDNQQVMEPVLRQLGIWDFFQVAIFTSEDGRAKPNPGLFHRMAKELGADNHQVLHIGDNVNADYRAIEAGLQAVVYAPNGSDLPHIRSMKELIGK